MSKTIQAHVLGQYQVLQQMGSGAYGHVWQVQQKKTKKQFALKKVFDAFRNSIDAQRTYRQVQILNQLDHQNIIKLIRVIKSKNKKDLYLIFQFMEADLHSVVGSNILQKMHQIFVFYQILKALKYLHSAQLIHRDLKPSNILLNSQCQIKICDFGLIRTLNSQNNQQAILSEQVATKWYRAPQLLLGSRSYRKPIDVWSFGCIIAQILIGKPLFAGDSTLNQLQKIIQFTGNVSKEDIQSLDSPIAQQLITQIKIKKKSFRQYFSSVDLDFWELLKGSLQFNPKKRMTIQQILQLQIFNEFRNQILNLKTCNKAIKPRIDDNTRFHLKIYRQKIYEDIDKKNQSISFKQKKTHQIENLQKKNHSISKKRIISNQKIIKNSLQVKKRPFSQTNYKQIKQKSLEKDRKMRKAQSNKSFDSINNSKLNPYKKQLLLLQKSYLNKISKKALDYYKKPQIKNNLFRKKIQPSTSFNKISIIQQKDPKNKNIDFLQNNKNQSSQKNIKKVTSSAAKKFNKNNILKKLGFEN